MDSATGTLSLIIPSNLVPVLKTWRECVWLHETIDVLMVHLHVYLYICICCGVNCIDLCIACIYVHICYGVDRIGYQWPYGTSGLEASHFCSHRDAANWIWQCSFFFHTARIPVSHTYMIYVRNLAVFCM